MLELRNMTRLDVYPSFVDFFFSFLSFLCFLKRAHGELCSMNLFLYLKPTRVLDDFYEHPYSLSCMSLSLSLRS